MYAIHIITQIENLYRRVETLLIVFYKQDLSHRSIFSIATSKIPAETFNPDKDRFTFPGYTLRMNQSVP